MADHAPESENMKLTLGQAIDQCIAALEDFEPSDQQTILRAVYAHLKISGPAGERKFEEAGKQETGRVDPAVEPRKPPPPDMAGMDIRTFKENKAPSSARQMACVVAYYLSEIATGDERREVVNTEQMERYFKQAKYPLPNKLEQLLIDCKSSGYFENAGGRGEYKLTRVGHNLVAHSLPVKGKGG